ncbi:FtsW/RodA/SpoVE family cell cycle protein [Dictyoglomus thermophilum]|uniref:Probable peptidoglycan glycosyltransferase FtsW n=1 Tax=Dictyoglomus thermophilum (strain ATCC 35947 / DSM 3960 / H-6-12) TaxID=309799 RepID=B5YEL4_DICT6|nr:FtsW/RodA/SpoVE family cell cycle protein [Dictyoglomus thermophilum]ACI20143.1 cell division protein FtsW, putative [Dictyoglomus thermophilum H-6-12]MCX7719767.1 FtsW/RodA/SpoVE family cell cycle protein [Dictyoglomus thermophilum]
MKRYDRLIFILALILSLLSLPIIHTASWKWASMILNNPSYFFQHQLIYLPLAIGISFIISGFPLAFWRKNSLLLLIISIFLLTLVFVPPFGKVSRNVARWIEIGPIQIQPVEVLRFSWIIFLASFLSSNSEKNKIEDVRFFWIILFLFVISVILYFQPNMSMVVLFFISTFVILFISKMDIKQTLIMLLIIFLIFAFGALTGEYRKERLVFNKGIPFFKTFQQEQALKAIKDGGFFGKGWGRGLLKFYIPEAYNDFLFPVIFEEGGLMAGTVILILYFLLMLSVFNLSLKAVKIDTFYGLLSMGILVYWCVEISLNILMNLGFLPVMGLPLPFLSFGGSSMMINWAQVGLLMKIAISGDKK